MYGPHTGVEVINPDICYSNIIHISIFKNRLTTTGTMIISSKVSASQVVLIVLS